MSTNKSYAQETADRLRKEGNFKDADVDVNDVIQIIEDDEEYIQSLNKKLAAKDAEIAELRECLKEACEVACDGCRLAVWHNQKFVKCKKHKNWKCPFGTERWRKALEGGNNAD